MTCKDCIHFNACYKMAIANNAATFYTLYADGCEKFSDRSLWVKLPCRLNLPKELYRYMFDNDYKKIVVKCKVYKVTAHGFTLMHYLDGRKWNYTYDSIGKTVFLTREEAEQALEEREKNG